METAESGRRSEGSVDFARWRQWATRWNSRPRLRLLIAAGASAWLLLAVGVAVAARGVAQPIAFNHRLHAERLHLDCELCHPHVRTGAHPGLPTLETCAMCHQAQQGDSRESWRVTAFVEGDSALVFAKLFTLPAHVFYTHRRHVGIADLECKNCHGEIARTTTPPGRPLVRITMGFCLECHRRTGQTTDCVACHR